MIIKMRGLVDRSGSMAAWHKPVVGGVNAYLQTVKDDREGRKADLTIATFDSMGFDLIRKCIAGDVELIREDEFEPRALTPLYDATDSALNDNVDEGPEVRNVLWILTDGLENASKKHDTASIRALVEAKRKKGWLILFLGANIDAWQQAREMGIPPEHTMNVHMQGRNAQQAPGLWNRVTGGKSNPIGMALAAAAGLGLAYALLRPSQASASTLAFSEDQRNAAMGVDGVSKTWQDAVQEDIAAFEEPCNSIYDLPEELNQQISLQPTDFDPSLGSLTEDGSQHGGMSYDQEIASADDVPSLESQEDDRSDDRDDRQLVTADGDDGRDTDNDTDDDSSDAGGDDGGGDSGGGDSGGD